MQQQLKNAGLKVTQARMAILNLLMQQEHELTVKQIYQQLYQNQQKLSLATVYRVIADLETAGLIIQNKFNRDEAQYFLPSFAQKSVMQIQYTDLNGHDQTQFLQSLKGVFEKFNVDLLDIQSTKNPPNDELTVRSSK